MQLAALTFIVALAFGIVALTLLYVGSAVVVLERFARVARPNLSTALFWVLASVFVAALGLEWTQAEFVSAATQPWPWTWGKASAAAGVVVAIAMFGVRLLLRWLRPARLAEVSVALLATAATWAVTGSGKAGVVVVPVLIVGLFFGLFWWRGRRRGEARISEGVRLLGILFVTLVVASVVGWIAGRGDPGESLAWLGQVIFTGLAVLVMLGLLPLAASGFLDLRGSVEWFIAVRYLVAKRRQVFISAITGICVAGIAAGVWLIIVVLSVMNGFERTWRDEILGNRAHFSVQSTKGPFADYAGILDTVRSTPGVIGASPFIDTDGMVRTGKGNIHTVRVRGIEPGTISGVSDLEADMILGSLADLENPDIVEPGGDPGIIVGSQLAVSLGLGIGDSVVLISPYGGARTPLGPAPRLQRFAVAGIFRSTFFQYDEAYTYVTLEAGQDFRRAGDVVDGIDARTTDFYRSRTVGDDVTSRLGYPFYSRDWKDFFPAFFQALKSERVMMFLLLTMIMVVAAFVIVATLIMMIMEKSSDIAILKAMGAEDAAIERIFAIEGTLIGLAGTAIGVVAGIAVTNQLPWIQDQIEAITGIDTLPASVYQFSTLPSEIVPLQVGFVVAIAMVLSLGATLLPSRQGAALDPAEALRYE